MIRAVLDCNVLVSGFPAWRGVPATILDAWACDVFELVISEHIIMGIVRAWDDPYYRRRYSGRQVSDTVSLLRSQANFVVPVDDVHGIAPNREDDLVLATAIAGSASWLVTGDISFRKVGEYRGVRIISPRAFLDELEQRGK